MTRKKHSRQPHSNSGAAGVRTLPLSKEALDALERQRALFRENFGREPGSDDLVFFSGNGSLQEPEFSAVVVGLMRRAGMPPQIIYAFQQTGFILSEANAEYFDADAREEWGRAVEEYFMLQAMEE